MAIIIECSGLEPAEQEKVERLDGRISHVFICAGLAVRFCQGRADGDRRSLNFHGGAGIVASISSREFLTASDDEAVALIAHCF
jgi:hypothetical protein